MSAEQTEWHNVVIFNENLGKIAEQYCREERGLLEGQLQTREYTDRDGNQRKTTEVVLPRFRGELTLLDSRGRGDAPDAGGAFEGSTPSYGRSAPADKGGEQAPNERLEPCRRHHRRRHSIPERDLLDHDLEKSVDFWDRIMRERQGEKDRERGRVTRS